MELKSQYFGYGKFPKIQTLPEFLTKWHKQTMLKEQSLFAIPLSILRNSCIRSKFYTQKKKKKKKKRKRSIWNKVFEKLGLLL